MCVGVATPLPHRTLQGTNVAAHTALLTAWVQNQGDLPVPNLVPQVLRFDYFDETRFY